jgi:hypothetical protein
MKSKTFVILLISFCFLAGVAYFSLLDRKAQHGEINQTLYGTLPIEKISKIIIFGSDGAINLSRKPSLWVVEDRFDYLADFSSITGLVSNIQSAKIGRSFAASPDAISRLGLHSPDAAGIDPGQKGIRLIFKNAENSLLADAILGKTREMTAGTGGHYIMPVQGGKIYLVDKKFDDIGKTVADWIKKDVIHIQEQEIESVVCRPLHGKTVIYALKRDEKEKEPVLQDRPDAPPLDPSKIDDVFTALSPLTIDDVAGNTGSDVESEIEFAFLFEYHLFDHAVYSVIPGQAKNKDKPKYYVKIAAHLEDEESVSKQKVDSEEGGMDLSRRSSQTERLMQNWVYEIPEWKFKRFIHKTDDLFQVNHKP